MRVGVRLREPVGCVGVVFCFFFVMFDFVNFSSFLLLALSFLNKTLKKSCGCGRLWACLGAGLGVDVRGYVVLGVFWCGCGRGRVCVGVGVGAPACGCVGLWFFFCSKNFYFLKFLFSSFLFLLKTKHPKH